MFLAAPFGAFAKATELKKRLVLKEGETIDDYFKLSADASEFKSQIVLHKDWMVNFNVEHSLAPILGFDKTTVIKNVKITTSRHTVQIQVFNSLFFLTNITHLSIFNGKYIPYIFHHSKHTPPGYNIVVNPSNISYKSLTTNVLNTIDVWVIDERGVDVNFNSESLTVELKLIRKAKRLPKHVRNKLARFEVEHFG